MVCEYPQHYVQAPPTGSNLGGRLILLGFAALVVDCIIHTVELHAENDTVQAETLRRFSFQRRVTAASVRNLSHVAF